jgi:signal transduction histidine kinase
MRVFRAVLAPRVRGVIADVLLSLVVAALTVPAVVDNQDAGPLLWIIGFAIAAALLFRRRWPVGVLVFCGVAGLVEMIAFRPAIEPQPYNAGVLVAVYTVVKYADRLRPGLIAGALLAIAVVVEVFRHDNAQPWWSAGLSYLLICGGVWLSGYVGRIRRLYIASLEERALTAEREHDALTRIAVAEERAAIARELHDVVAHSLAVMIVQADGAEYALAGKPDDAREAVRQIAATGREALGDMRRLVRVLRGPAEDVSDRRRVTVDDLDALVDRATSAGLDVRMLVVGTRTNLPHGVAMTIFRLVQEALTNVIRHAGPGTAVLLRVAYDVDDVAVSVADNGGGVTSKPAAPGGHGLVGMAERVAVHGGTFSAGARTGGGWLVDARLPVRIAEPTPAPEVPA